MPTAELDAGPIDYVDTGGDGPVVVFTHGFPMDHRQWRKVVPLLPDARCILPTLPMGAHHTPMRPGTDLTHLGQAAILADFLDALDLDDVTLVMNDWGGAQFIVVLDRADRVGRMVFAACEAFDNFPPKPARPAAALTRIPGGTWLLMQMQRTSYFRHGQKAYGAMAHSRIPDDVLDAWFRPAITDPAIRRDLGAFAGGTPPTSTLMEWSRTVATFDRPALVVRAADDLMMPADHGRRLAQALPRGRLVEIAASRTLIPEDQPEEFAGILRDFLDASR